MPIPIYRHTFAPPGSRMQLRQLQQQVPTIPLTADGPADESQLGPTTGLLEGREVTRRARYRVPDILLLVLASRALGESAAVGVPCPRCEKAETFAAKFRRREDQAGAVFGEAIYEVVVDCECGFSGLDDHAPSHIGVVP